MQVLEQNILCKKNNQKRLLLFCKKDINVKKVLGVQKVKMDFKLYRRVFQQEHGLFHWITKTLHSNS